MKFNTENPTTLKDLYKALEADSIAVENHIQDLEKRMKDPKMQNTVSRINLGNCYAKAVTQYSMLVDFKIALRHLLNN